MQSSNWLDGLVLVLGTLFDVGGWVALAGAFVVLYRVGGERKKLFAESRKLAAESDKLVVESDKAKADTSETYQKVAGIAAEQNLKLLERITELLSRVTRLECDIARLKKSQDDLGCLLADWMVGIDKLIRQIREYGKQPIRQPNVSEALRMLVMEEAETRAQDHLEEYLRRSHE
jgi:hypothetical protein